ncbi:hypothetical protein D3C76_978350 [compost metagenome]
MRRTNLYSLAVLDSICFCIQNRFRGSGMLPLWHVWPDRQRLPTRCEDGQRKGLRAECRREYVTPGKTKVNSG